MTVACPRCGTRYRMPPRSRHAADSTYRCARCRHEFAAARAAEEPVELDVDDATAVDPEVTADDEFAFDDEEEPEPVEPPPRRARSTGRSETPPPVRGTTPARFALRALLAVGLGYATLSIYFYTHPDVLRAALDRVPLLGARLAETRLQAGSIQLADVRGTYERVKGDQLVFVIAGTAINNSPMTVKSIQVEGRIMGGQEQRQTVFCGAAPRDVHDLSIREIALLQTLEPSRDWMLGPGEQTGFVVVFASPPRDLREFAAEVMTVQGQARVRRPI
jgi:predicted Zn finger-like uncharacterized protein